MPEAEELVSIGIPTFNRSALLSRAIQSAQSQTHRRVEILVSDNASTDDTAAVCASLMQTDDRIRYVRAETNRGAAWNFNRALELATGDYFMWLGDDDWIDAAYVERCLSRLLASEKISLVGGLPEYLRNGSAVSTGDLIDVSASAAWLRVLSYYMQVSDNGIFYGLMRTHQIRALPLRNELAADWFLIAGMAFQGEIEMVREVAVHRELGGTSASFSKMCDSLGLPRFHAIFPELTIALLVARDVLGRNPVMGQRSLVARLVWSITLCVTLGTRLTALTLTRRMKKELARLRRTFS